MQSTSYYGFSREDFAFDGHDCILVRPNNPKPGNPWVWRAEFFGAFDQVDREMVGRGYHLAYIRLSNMYGCPAAIEAMYAFYREMVSRFRLGTKPHLFGFSRGGLYAVNFALTHPDCVGKLYLDAPVLDIASWPGGKGRGMGDARCWAECLNAYGLKEENADEFRQNPLDRAAELAGHRIPVIIVAGGRDRTVPYSENGEHFARKFRAAGGECVTIIKENCDHHPHSLDDPTPVADFLD